MAGLQGMAPQQISVLDAAPLERKRYHPRRHLFKEYIYIHIYTYMYVLLTRTKQPFRIHFGVRCSKECHSVNGQSTTIAGSTMVEHLRRHHHSGLIAFDALGITTAVTKWDRPMRVQGLPGDFTLLMWTCAHVSPCMCHRLQECIGTRVAP